MISGIIELLRSIRFNLVVNTFEDRWYLREVMLPQMAASNPSNILLAGVRRYTRGYPKLFDPDTTKVWTIDLDPEAARWGNGSLHKTGDIREVDKYFHKTRFDAIHINGLLGFGVDSPEDIDRMVGSVHHFLVPGGCLMLGWDVDRTNDPLHNENLLSLFRHKGQWQLPARHSVLGMSGHRHLFDWFESMPTA